MAQKHVTDFFLSRKRGGASRHASKRMKVTADTGFLAQSTTCDIPKPCVQAVQSTAVGKSKESGPGNSILNGSKTTRKEKPRSVLKTDKKERNIKMTKFLQKSVEKEPSFDSDASSDNMSNNPELSICISTAVTDDHGCSPASSPAKRLAETNDSALSDSCKRGRNTGLMALDVYKTPEKFDFTPYAEHDKSSVGVQLSSARKKLILNHAVDKPQQLSPVFDFKGSASEKPVISTNMIGKSPLNNSNIGEKIGKCSSLSELRQKLAQFSGKKAKAESVFERARQNLDKRSKDKLPAITNCESEQVGSTVEHKQPCAVESSSEVRRASAFERHSSLAVASPPTFQLPFKYKVLGDTFQSSDTVVSMLTNRAEICTFSKLKAAVQEMTKRAFELSHLGQIKTVYSTAYCYRQEKDLPVFGGKASCYQLTIEPILDDSAEANSTGKRVAFTATKLLERKNIFLHNLVNIVKKYHEEFLKKLKIKVNEEDIKRWHPKFKLDELPDVEPSELPQPPFVKKFSTAKDVLDEVQDKLNPRIQMALEMVSNKSRSPAKTENAQHVSTSVSSVVESSKVISQSSANSDSDRLNSFKGIPSSLLERVRAKQAKKLELEMTRSTEDTKRLEMLQRLPELTRILRTHFVTQKRPAVPVVDVVKSFTNSYKSSLGTVEAESHLKLIAEVVPEWMNIVHLKIGSFVKINRDLDLMSIHDKIHKLIKSS